jgi:NAD(P)-dependent dehydrogenase (short-subunit alcohol dehydrogenase family)
MTDTVSRPRPLADQVVVVLGASSGIGRATALCFADRGTTRLVVASRGAEALDSLADELRAQDADPIAVPTDITDEAAVRALVRAAEERFGRVDTWVTAPAVSVYGPVMEITLDEFRRVTEVNYLGHVAAAQAAVPALERAGGGVYIGVDSVEGYRAMPLHAPYSASKFALRAFHDALRMELADAGSPVEVVSILPAAIGTPFFEHSRSKVGAMPKPPPPVYAPELVAETIVGAAEHPRREIPVGDAALAFLTGQRLSPALSDAVLSVVGPRVQVSDRPDDGTDILDTPTPGPGRVRGIFSDHLVTAAPLTRAAAAVVRPGELLLRARRRRTRR